MRVERVEVRTGELVGQETIATGEADGVGEDGPGHGVAWAQASPWTGHLRLFCLKADVEL